MSNNHLATARRVKNDEFYTRYDDIEAEVKHYQLFFQNKVVYCNCDDGSSQFKAYFTDHFYELGLKTLYCTGASGEFYAFDGTAIITDTVDGDFRSQDCTAILSEADIIVSNPPFSLFREYMHQLEGKDYLVLGSKAALSYKEVFPAFKNGTCRWGFTAPRYFDTPYGPVNLNGLCRWYTSFPKPSQELFEPTMSFSENAYQQFDWYPAINVNRTSEIPADYDGLMGVPVTALDHLNGSYEIVDLIARYAVIDNSYDKKGHQLTEVNGEPKFSRLIIKKKTSK